MRIERVQIENFRSFRSFDLDLGGSSAFLIGENGGGKSSLLTAVARALGRDLSFTSADFADLAQPIDLRVTLSGLNTDQQGVFGNYVEFSGAMPRLTLGVRAVWNSASDEADVEHGYPRRVGSRSRRAERDAVSLQWLPTQRDPGRMLQFGPSTNVMGRLLEALPLAPALDHAANEIRGASDHLANDTAFLQLLDDARDQLAQLVPDVTTGVYTMGQTALTSRDLLRQFELAVAHLGGPVAVTRQSSGVAQLSIFVFATMLARSDPGRILLIDEPEVSLHPQAQRALMRSLGTLQSQILVATHSASLLDRADPRRVLRLRRSGATTTVVSPTSLTDEVARRLARFTSPHTAEAFFARSVVLVEGFSDQLALEALAEKRGRNLDAEGVAIVPVGGAFTIDSFMRLYGPQGFDLGIAALCDDAEESAFIRALANSGLGAGRTRTARESSGLYVCVADLEDELVRALGESEVESVIDAHGDLAALNLFRNQPANRALLPLDQLKGFLKVRNRKVEYAPLLVDALDLARVPAPLDGVLSHV